MPSPLRGYSEEQIEAAVVEAVAFAGLPDSYRISVRALLRSRNDRWRVCCGGNCRPCIGQVEEAVDHARELLEKIPPALSRKAPEDDPTASTESADDDADRNWGLDYQ